MLPLTLAGDFTDVEDIASPALPVITREGPEEYIFISDIYLAEGLIYLLDAIAQDPGRRFAYARRAEKPEEETEEA